MFLHLSVNLSTGGGDLLSGRRPAPLNRPPGQRHPRGQRSLCIEKNLEQRPPNRILWTETCVDGDPLDRDILDREVGSTRPTGMHTC